MASGGGLCDDLTILCVTQAEPCVLRLLEQLVADSVKLDAQVMLACDGGIHGLTSYEWADTAWLTIVHSRGYVESALDQALSVVRRKYVLRIDDDESLSHAMFEWLRAGAYRQADHWQFSRQHMWETAKGFGAIMTPHLWNDYQTRLSVREKAGGRSGVHAPSPHGGGEIAPVSIIHWKYVVRTREDRRRIAQTYDSYSPGYGTGNMLPFSLPEEAYDEMRVVEAGDGSVPWTPKWETVVDNRDHGF